MHGKLRILLIDPSDPWVTNNRNLKHVEQVMLPLGMMYLSAYLKQRLQDRLEIRIISTIVDVRTKKQLREILTQFSPHIIGIKTIVFYTKVVKQILAVSRMVLPNALIILGGPGISADSHFIANSEADIFAEGEGEETLLEIVQHIIAHDKNHLIAHLHKIKGISFYRNGRLIRTPRRTPLQNLDELPIPDYSAINLAKYRAFLNYGYNRRKTGVLFTSRGCPYSCIYCHNVFGKTFRSRNAENICEEIAFLHNKYDIHNFCIIDDNFACDKKRVERFADKIIADGPDVKLYFPNGIRADSLTCELVDRLILAGTIWLTFSLETASPRLQRFIKKNVKIAKLTEIINHSCEKGIITNLCVMVGFPTETVEDAKLSLDYLRQFKKIVLPYYFSVKYYPGTELFSLAEIYDIQINQDAQTVPYHGHIFQETPLLSKKDFEKLYYRYLTEVFLDPLRMQHAISILQRHFTMSEINDMYTLFFRKKITDIQVDILSRLT